ncbi:MAG: nicotinamide riboside transporter PnuC [Hyphomonas sp.]
MTEPQTPPASGSGLPSRAILAGLVLVTAAISFTAWRTGAASSPEAIAFITGVFCVWLVTRQNIWNFPLGLVTVGIYAFVFYDSRLFATAGLQLIFFALNLIGWYLWLYGGENRTALKVTPASTLERALTLLGIAGATALLYRLLEEAGGATKFWDALVTSISLAAQWMQSRKILDCWYLWILADILYIPIAFHNGLYLTAMLYGVFLALATMGLIEWRRALKT